MTLTHSCKEYSIHAAPLLPTYFVLTAHMEVLSSMLGLQILGDN